MTFDVFLISALSAYVSEISAISAYVSCLVLFQCVCGRTHARTLMTFDVFLISALSAYVTERDIGLCH